MSAENTGIESAAKLLSDAGWGVKPPGEYLQDMGQDFHSIWDVVKRHTVLMEEEGPETERQIWLYDTFTGMVAPGEEDRIASSGEALSERKPEGWWSSPLDEVKNTLTCSDLGSEKYRFIEGPVELTLETDIPERLAVLRLDTDWYESTMKELEVLYPRLSPGGILIIDDYGHFTGARKAVDEYFRSIGETVLLHRSDYTGRVLVKKNPPVTVV